MNNYLFVEIQKMMPQFSKGQRRIAAYIMEHYDKAAFMTAAKLGGTVGISESTVVRFATELGFVGYPQLQKAMQEMIRSKLTSVQRIELTSNRIGDNSVLESVLGMDIDKIRTTLEETSKESFQTAVDTILKARKIFIIGVRSCAALATFLHYYFKLIFEEVVLLDTPSEMELYEQMLWITGEDVVIDISFPRYSKRAVKALQIAMDRGATVVAITDSVHSPLAVEGAILLMARSEMASFVDSLVAPLSLLNALIVAVAFQKRQEISDTFEKLEHIWDEYQIYEKIEEQK